MQQVLIKHIVTMIIVSVITGVVLSPTQAKQTVKFASTAGPAQTLTVENLNNRRSAIRGKAWN